MIAAAAQRTKYIRLGTGVKSLPFTILHAREAMAQLDHMTRGRTIMGVGPGALPTDVHMLGIEMADIRPRMDESLDIIIALMRGETVSRRTDWFHLREGGSVSAALARPMMELAVTSVRSALRRPRGRAPWPGRPDARSDERCRARPSRRELAHPRTRMRPHRSRRRPVGNGASP